MIEEYIARVAEKYRSNLLRRFWAKVDKSGPLHPYDPTLGNCWMWVGACNQNGVGLFRVGPATVGAPRLALEIKLDGSLHRSLLALHSCDRPPCVNPSHLRAGTHKENVEDCIQRGRFKGGAETYSRRTHCVRGHEFSEENTRWNGNVRTCRACHCFREKRRRESLTL